VKDCKKCGEPITEEEIEDTVEWKVFVIPDRGWATSIETKAFSLCAVPLIGNHTKGAIELGRELGAKLGVDLPKQPRVPQFEEEYI